MRTLICLLVFILIQLQAFTQHCGWDNAHILIVDVRDGVSDEVVNGLNIYLINESGEPYLFPENMRSYRPEHLFVDSDTLMFGQNVKPENEEFSEVNGPFPFAVNSYMILIAYNNYFRQAGNSKDQIVIEDPQGRYQKQALPFSQENIASLCTSSAIWHNKDALEQYRISVKLKRK